MIKALGYSYILLDIVGLDITFWGEKSFNESIKELQQINQGASTYSIKELQHNQLRSFKKSIKELQEINQGASTNQLRSFN